MTALQEPARAAGVAPSQRSEPRDMDEGEQHIDTTRARAGATPHMTRYILPISLGLVVLAFVLLLFLWR